MSEQLDPQRSDNARCTCGETACESDLCDCDSTPCPVDHAADYRRERYAAAMAAANDGGPEWAYEWYPEADAAMAVADEEHDLIREAAEFHQRRYVAAHDENARLRAELDASERRYRSSVETYQDMRAEFSKVVRWREEDAKEMERLRTELATVKEECESWKDTFYGQG